MRGGSTLINRQALRIRLFREYTLLFSTAVDSGRMPLSAISQPPLNVDIESCPRQSGLFEASPVQRGGGGETQNPARTRPSRRSVGSAEVSRVGDDGFLFPNESNSFP